MLHQFENEEDKSWMALCTVCTLLTNGGTNWATLILLWSEILTYIRPRVHPCFILGHSYALAIMLRHHRHHLDYISSCLKIWIMTQGQMEGIHLFVIIFPESLPMNYNKLQLAPLPRGGVRKKRIATPGQWHYKHTIDVETLVYLLYDQWKGSINFL
jgi:hypothetical protein